MIHLTSSAATAFVLLFVLMVERGASDQPECAFNDFYKLYSPAVYSLNFKVTGEGNTPYILKTDCDSSDDEIVTDEFAVVAVVVRGDLGRARRVEGLRTGSESDSSVGVAELGCPTKADRARKAVENYINTLMDANGCFRPTVYACEAKLFHDCHWKVVHERAQKLPLLQSGEGALAKYCKAAKSVSTCTRNVQIEQCPEWVKTYVRTVEDGFRQSLDSLCDEQLPASAEVWNKCLNQEALKNCKSKIPDPQKFDIEDPHSTCADLEREDPVTQSISWEKQETLKCELAAGSNCSASADVAKKALYVIRMTEIDIEHCSRPKLDGYGGSGFSTTPAVLVTLSALNQEGGQDIQTPPLNPPLSGGKLAWHHRVPGPTWGQDCRVTPESARSISPHHRTALHGYPAPSKPEGDDGVPGKPPSFLEGRNFTGAVDGDGGRRRPLSTTSRAETTTPVLVRCAAVLRGSNSYIREDELQSTKGDRLSETCQRDSVGACYGGEGASRQRTPRGVIDAEDLPGGDISGYRGLHSTARAHLVYPLVAARHGYLCSRIEGDQFSFEQIRQTVLKELRLSPDEYRKKFVSTSRRKDESWQQFGTRLSSYLTYYVEARGVESFERLKALLVADQLKASVGADALKYITLKEGKEWFDRSQIADLLALYDQAECRSATPIRPGAGGAEKGEIARKPEGKKIPGGFKPSGGRFGGKTCYRCGSRMSTVEGGEGNRWRQ
ncbi:hypothetical protein HPB47_011684 [Ixodes persulcatus]|uniref:Uncharacterized protein n=1 Tax=Ixodes persulcatus TaxID=34615 RepID=A0AC60NVN6_IXOPE|nr:hypothetical protein HPB47_011684 [Ixodes persulcatus]